jgi:actin-related protein 6
MAPARKSRATGPPPPSRTLVLDSGANTIKAGIVTAGDTTAEQPRVIPNCIARDRHRKTYVGSELDKCKDFGEIAVRRPVEKGFIVNWEAEKEIWDREFFDDGRAPLYCDPSDSRLVLTEQPNALPALQSHCDQMVFEEYGFASYYRGLGAFSLRLQLLSTPASSSLTLFLFLKAPPSTRTTTSRRYSEPRETPTRQSRSPPKSCWWSTRATLTRQSPRSS